MLSNNSAIIKFENDLLVIIDAGTGLKVEIPVVFISPHINCMGVCPLRRLCCGSDFNSTVCYPIANYLHEGGWYFNVSPDMFIPVKNTMKRVMYKTPGEKVIKKVRKTFDRYDQED